MMNRRRFLGASLGLAPLLLAACNATISPFDMTDAADDIASDLLNQIRGKLDLSAPILATTMIPADPKGHPSAFGEILAQNIGTTFTRSGYSLVEARLRSTVEINASGLYVLSSDATKVARQVAAKAAIVGTYTAGTRYVIVNARILAVDTGIDLAATNRQFPLTDYDLGLFKA